MSKFAEVLLPLAVKGTFTYAVPDGLTSSVGYGFRVSVPLGKSKITTGIVVELHDREPAFKCRYIIAVIDSHPMVLPQQRRLWKWIADYYMCTEGEVLYVALPAGLKNEENYRPRYETCVTLTDDYRNEEALHRALDSLHRSAQQQKAFISFLSLSHWDTLEGDTCRQEPADVTRDELLNASLCRPAAIKALVDKGILALYQREVGRIGGYTGEQVPLKPLNRWQEDAYNSILLQLYRKNVVLLHGVTSSGKTEIYIHLIQKTLQEKKQVLYLLPEIALTVQITHRLQRVFGDELGIYHSKYSDEERVEIWQKQLSTQPYGVILGARSAVFLPFQNLGLVIVDEEHETSFKQQDPAPRYHARSVAIMMAAMAGAKTLLGTATPSMESYYNAETGKYGLTTLTHRYQDLCLPEIEVVDVADLRRRKMMTGPFSPQLLAAIRTSLANKEQVILFQNRRGFAPMIECKTCGWVPKCEHCDVSLTYHRRMNVLTCHYCGATYRVPAACPCCEEKQLRDVGYGTEKIEDDIRELFPKASISRMDLDTARTRSAYERIINDFSAGRSNILIGTQMVSKGLDFDRVGVVGILNADNLFQKPDFRAYEQGFQMIVQVSGRAGRKGKQGKVILQTKHPDMEQIRQAAANQFEAFYQQAKGERAYFRYPPFSHVVYIFLKHRDEPVIEAAATQLAAMLRHVFGERILGPDKPPVQRVKTLFIRKIVLKMERGQDMKKMRECLLQAREALVQDSRFRMVQVFFDVDPL